MFKKISITLLFISICLPFIGNFNHVLADDYYPMACTIYEVSNIKDGGFESVACYDNFSDAKALMKTNDNYVVRYANSYSPSKIVAMNSGIVQTYPGRSNSLIMYIYQNMEIRDNFWKYTYVQEHNEALYIDTETMSSNYYPNGAVHINLKGFDGYADLKNVDLIPTQFIENGWPIWLGGSNSYNGESAYNAIIDQNYYMLVSDGNYQSLQYTYHYTYAKKQGNKCTSRTYLIDNAENYLDAGLSLNTKYYSFDGINFYSDKQCTKLVATVYNYYQFLPLRSKTNISADTFNNYLTYKGVCSSSMLGSGSVFIDCQNEYGVNALQVFAMACHESAYGTSVYADDRYNLFGWGAYDSNPSNALSYDSVLDCVSEHMGVNLRYYMDYDHGYYFGSCLGNKGAGFNVLYASDAEWSTKICAYCYEIDKYSNNFNGNLSDYNNYTIGLVDSFDPNIYTNYIGNDVLYTGRYGKNYQKDLTVILLENNGSRYKIQSTNPVENGKRIHQNGLCVSYDWSDSVGYIDISVVKQLNNFENQPVDNRSTPTYEAFSSVRDISLANNTLTIIGVGGIQGMDFDKNDSSIKHEIIFTDANDESISYSFTCENISVNYDLNDEYIYTYTGYKLSINLSECALINSSYYLTLCTTNGNKCVKTSVRSAKDQYSSILFTNNNTNYRITSNYIYNYRIEFDIFNNQLNYSEINKPSSRKSLISYDKFIFNNDGTFEVKGHGFMYYLNYENIADIEYTVFLVKDDGTYIEMNTSLIDNSLDYKTLLDSNYNLDHISFRATCDLNDIYGEYNLILRIKNGSYVDYVEFINRSKTNLPCIKNENYDIELLTSNIRDRIYLVSKAKNA